MRQFSHSHFVLFSKVPLLTEILYKLPIFFIGLLNGLLLLYDSELFFEWVRGHSLETKVTDDGRRRRELGLQSIGADELFQILQSKCDFVSDFYVKKRGTSHVGLQLEIDLQWSAQESNTLSPLNSGKLAYGFHLFN